MLGCNFMKTIEKQNMEWYSDKLIPQNEKTNIAIQKIGNFPRISILKYL